MHGSEVDDPAAKPEREKVHPKKKRTIPVLERPPLDSNGKKRKSGEKGRDIRATDKKNWRRDRGQHSVRGDNAQK